MVTPEITSPVPAGRAIVHAAASGLSRLAAVWRAYRNRRAVARLLSWDARMLRDIGLTPGDVRSAMAERFTEDPSARLDALWRERRHALRAGARRRRAPARAREKSSGAA